MEINEKLRILKRNTQEIVTEKELEELLRTKKKPVVYLGTAITGMPHISYFAWVIKLADFLKVGFKVKLLLADLHGALDNTPWDVLEYRYKYYSKLIPLMFESIGADIKEFEIVKGSDFQMDKKYFYDVLKVSTFASTRDCKRAASEVVKMGDNPKLAGLIYPIMQMLDEEYLDVDIQYGGVDQRKILMFARENHLKIGYKPRIAVMTPILPGLTGEKMSASVEKSKIDLLDSPEIVKEKIKAAYCPAGIIEENGILAFIKHVLFTLKEDKKEPLVIKRPDKYGGNLVYNSYQDLERDYVEKNLHPLDLKNAIAEEINQLLEPIRKKFKDKEIVKKAYL